MTIAAFYERHAIDGRAVVQGEPETPQRWIVRMENQWGEVAYWHCQSNVCDVQALDPALEASVLLKLRAIGGRPRKTLLTSIGY